MIDQEIKKENVHFETLFENLRDAINNEVVSLNCQPEEIFFPTRSPTDIIIKNSRHDIAAIIYSW